MRPLRSAPVVLTLLLTVVLAACGGADDPVAGTGEPTTTSTSSTLPVPGLDEDDEARDCSAAELAEDVQDVRGDVPAPAWERRAEILDAAVACDYERLQELALDGDGEFAYTFGGGGPEQAAEHWRQLEESGEEDVLRLLVETLRLPPAPDDGLVVWPAAHRDSATEADWQAVVPLYGEEQVAEWRRAGSGFLGYRVGITDDGDWQYFIGGD